MTISDEEGLLAEQLDFRKPRFTQNSFQNIPGDVAGDVELAGRIQQVCAHAVPGIGAAGSFRSELQERLAFMAVVESDEQPLPRGLHEILEQVMGAGGPVQGVPFGCRVRQRCPGRVPGQFGPCELPGLQGDSQFAPAAGPVHQSPEGLGIENLIGKDNSPRRQVKLAARTDQPVPAKRVHRQMPEQAVSGLGSDLDENMAVRRAINQPQGCIRNESSKDRAHAGCRIEIGFVRPPNALATGLVIAMHGVVEGPGDKIRERQDTAAGASHARGQGRVCGRCGRLALGRLHGFRVGEGQALVNP